MKNQVFTPSENSRAVAASLIKRTTTGKTVFGLLPASIDIIQNLSSSEVSMKDILDLMAELVEEQDKTGKLSLKKFDGQRERKCFTISDNAREIFNKLAQKHHVSRDMLVENALLALCDKINEMQLTTEKKIEYANILIDMAKRMLDIYDEPAAREAREKLEACKDKDFGNFDDDTQSCGGLLVYIDALNELPGNLREFINIKKKEKGE